MQALRAAQVYDGRAFLGAGTVLLEGERIVGVERGHPEPPADADVTTYAGTLLPGLIDSHVHLVSNGDLGALERAGAATDLELDAQVRVSLTTSAAHGVTTVMDLGDCRYRTLEARALPRLPRVRAAEPPLTVPAGHCHFLGGVAAGVDGIEHFSCLTDKGPEASEELLQAAVAAGITIDLSLGFDPSQMPPPEMVPPGIRAVMEWTSLDFRTMDAHRAELARRIRAHGIRLVTGTDAGAAPPKRHGGTALAVQTLVEAGYPPAEAMATATSVAAEHVGVADITGSLRPGLAADLLVVDGDLASDPGARPAGRCLRPGRHRPELRARRPDAPRSRRSAASLLGDIDRDGCSPWLAQSLVGARPQPGWRRWTGR